MYCATFPVEWFWQWYCFGLCHCMSFHWCLLTGWGVEQTKKKKLEIHCTDMENVPVLHILREPHWPAACITATGQEGWDMVTQLPLKQPEKKAVNSPINRRLPTPRNTIALHQHRLIVHRPSKFYIQCILQTVQSFLKKGQRNVSMITSWDLSTWSRKTKQRSGTAVVPQALAWRKINLRQGTSNRACSASE